MSEVRFDRCQNPVDGGRIWRQRRQGRFEVCTHVCQAACHHFFDELVTGAEVIVDGTSIGPQTEYTYTSVDADHIISASFVDEKSIPLFGWTNDPRYTNAPYTLNSNPTTLNLQLNADDTTSKIIIKNYAIPKLAQSDYTYVEVAITGSANP